METDVQANVKEINVSSIMEEIKADIERRKLDGTLIPFDEIPLKNGAFSPEKFDELELRDNLYDAIAMQNVSSHRVIIGNPLAVFIKRILRRMLKFYVRPIQEDQNKFNESAARTLSQIKLYIEENEEMKRLQLRKIEELEEEIKILKEKDSDKRC